MVVFHLVAAALLLIFPIMVHLSVPLVRESRVIILSQVGIDKLKSLVYPTSDI